jgi:23S rRNA (adenine2503-C2)-methyltransferase
VGERKNLRDLGFDDLCRFAAEMGMERFRAEQIFRWVHGADATVEEMTNLSRPLRARLAEVAEVRRLDVELVQVSRDGTRKMRLRTADGRALESVLIPDGDATAPDDDDEEETQAAKKGDDFSNALFPRRPKLTQCVSSQVGCALDCAFCATATLGFGRNLSAGEIVDQVYRAQALVAGLPADDPTRRAGSDHVTNLVFMGMGEPLHNFNEVVRALGILTDDRGPGFSKRRITVSTAGLVSGIEKLAASGVGVNLAISLNATTDEVRDRIMPINKKWNIAALLGAVRRFPLERRRRVTFEYVLLDGVNDSLDDAKRLSSLVGDIPCKVNLIAWNPHDGAEFARPRDERVSEFQETLRTRGLAVYVRKSRGRDIDAACGQLAARTDGKKSLPLA